MFFVRLVPPYWFRYRKLRRPAKFEPAEQSIMLNVVFIAPFSEGFRLAKSVDNMRTATIPRLFNRCCPLAILWLVVSIVVNSVNLVLFARSLPHIFKEVFERVSPSVANSYAATAIAIVTTPVFVVASTDHITPKPVLDWMLFRQSVHSPTSSNHRLVDFLENCIFCVPSAIDSRSYSNRLNAGNFRPFFYGSRCSADFNHV